MRVAENEEMRDDFRPTVKELLAKRVGHRCSNPECRQPTSGPQVDPAKTVNVGVAAHITAASADGPRFDSALQPEERKSADNGIWLCQKCGKLVDNDAARYPVEKLQHWKVLAEATAVRELEGGSRPRDTGPGEPLADLAKQLAALADLFQQDLWRTRPQTASYAEGIQLLINSTEKRLRELRWHHPASLVLSDDARSRFEGVFRKLDELRGRQDDGVWYAGFTFLHLVHGLLDPVREAR